MQQPSVEPPACAIEPAAATAVESTASAAEETRERRQSRLHDRRARNPTVPSRARPSLPKSQVSFSQFYLRTGERLWTSSDDVSIKSEPKPSAQMANGNRRCCRFIHALARSLARFSKKCTAIRNNA
jgi:hypothetical protein